VLDLTRFGDNIHVVNIISSVVCCLLRGDRPDLVATFAEETVAENSSLLHAAM